MIPNSILTTIIVQTFKEKVGKFQANKEQKALKVSFRLPVDSDKEDGYRFLEVLVYGHMNYVGVYVRTRSDTIAQEDLEYDDDGDGRPKPGKDYVKEATAWERIAYHDSGWTAGIDKILSMYSDRIQGLSGVNWYETVKVPAEIQEFGE